MSSSPAYQYGQILGNMQAMFEAAAEEMGRGFRAAIETNKRMRAMKGADPETWRLMERERRSIKRYQSAVARERQIGARYVESLTDGLRKRYGL